MKNIYLIPTDKPSRLYEFSGQIILTNEPTNAFRNQHIYITSDEEIKEEDWCLYNKNHSSKNPDWVLVKCGVIEREEMHPISDGRLLLWMIKIILTTDQDLIKDGIQAIDDEFLEWFVRNPSCDEVKVVVSIKYFNLDELRERHIKGLPHLYSEKIGYKLIIPKEKLNPFELPKTILETLPFPELVKELATFYEKYL